MRERESHLPGDLHQDGAQRAAAVQLHRDGPKRLGGRGGVDLSGRGQRDRREGVAEEEAQETLRQSQETGYTEAGDGGFQVGWNEDLGEFEISACALEGEGGRR